MDTLKISDLSVGDWVRYGGIDYQVKSIDGAFERVTLIGNKEQRDESIYAIKPIVISERILVENDFMLSNLEEYTWSWSDGKYIVNYFVSGLIMVLKKGESISIHGTYIHTLQHALRLAGVEKEINL